MHLALSTHQVRYPYSYSMHDSLGMLNIICCVQALVWLCTATTLLAAMPVLVQEVRRPTARGLLVCMASSAFAFYLFSYQVMPYCPELVCTYGKEAPIYLHGEAACPFLSFGTYLWPKCLCICVPFL